MFGPLAVLYNYMENKTRIKVVDLINMELKMMMSFVCLNKYLCHRHVEFARCL